MGDVSEFFKSGFVSLHKNTTGKNYQQKTLKDRMNDFNNIRRETRNTLIFQKRQIDQNMSAINTPEQSKPIRKTEDKKEVKKPNKRLEMLNKWKADKQKRKEDEQKKAKPLFKVYHIPVEVGLPNLENVNRQIKGKPFKSQFAPQNHKFHPPKNIQPIGMICPNNDGTSKAKTKTQKIEANKVNYRQTPIVLQRNTRSAMSRKEQISEKLSNNLSKNAYIKTEVNRTNLGRSKNISQKTVPDAEPKNENKNKLIPEIKECPQKNTSIISNRRKLQYKDNPAIDKNTTKDIKCSSPKKNRTNEKTTKRRHLIDLTSSLLEVNSQPMNKEKYKKNVGKELNVCSSIEAAREIKKTPKKNKLKFDETPDSKNDAIVNEKKKSLRILKQPKLEERNTITTFNNCSESADVTPKKIVGWDVIDIVESDDEVAVNNRTPKRIPKKYKKTPRKGQIRETTEDYAMQESLINDVNETSSVLDVNSQPMNKEKYKKSVGKGLNVSSSIEATKEIKKTPKKNKLKFDEIPVSKNGAIVSEKKKSLRISKQAKLKEHNAMSTFNNCSESADVTPKKIVGWNVIEVVDSDDEVFSKAINNRTPKNISKKYKKTPRKEQNTETIEDYAMEDTLLNDVKEERNVCSAPKNYGIEGTQTVTYTRSRNSTVGSATGSASPDYPIEYVSPANKDLNTSLHTPAKNGSREVSPVYISPFVTVSRGKSRARKEYQVRHSTGCLGDSPEFDKDISNNISPKAGADYFTRKLNNEISRIEDMCDDWSKYKDDCPEEANDMIDVAIGQSKLLMSKKFQQFRDLIDQCRNNEYKEKPVTCKDLHGFWDMIYMQVEDLNKRFNSLNVLKANNWQEIVPEKKPVIKRGRGRPKKAAVSSSLKDLIKAARIMKKSNGAGGNNLTAPQSQETGEFVKLNSPIRGPKIPTPRSSSARKSLRVSLLAGQAKSRLSSSPGLTMMKISQAIKCGDGLTPSKSILKTDLNKSANRITKSVLFKDDLENHFEEHVISTKAVLPRSLDDSANKENDGNEINLISFSPVTPTRRSRRLSKIN